MSLLKPAGNEPGWLLLPCTCSNSRNQHGGIRPSAQQGAHKQVPHNHQPDSPQERPAHLHHRKTWRLTPSSALAWIKATPQRSRPVSRCLASASLASLRWMLSSSRVTSSSISRRIASTCNQGGCTQVHLSHPHDLVEVTTPGGGPCKSDREATPGTVT